MGFLDRVLVTFHFETHTHSGSEIHRRHLDRR